MVGAALAGGLWGSGGGCPTRTPPRPPQARQACDPHSSWRLMIFTPTPSPLDVPFPIPSLTLPESHLLGLLG